MAKLQFKIQILALSSTMTKTTSAFTDMAKVNFKNAYYLPLA